MEEQMMTECELLVMKVIWKSDDVLSLQEITERVNRDYKKNWKPQTVSTFLGRIVRRGYLSMERRGRVFYYHPLMTEDEYGKNEILKCVDFWSNGRADSFLSAFIEERKLTDEEKKRIRSLLDDLA